MHITLVGMSNIGKTHWAKRLTAACGYEHVDCDSLIGQMLTPELAGFDGQGISGVAAWMGQPHEPRYEETSRKYLASERAVLKSIVARLRAGKSAKPVVVDATGSVIYAGDVLINDLRALTRVVYLETSPEHAATLYQRYLKEPKPVIWGDAYMPWPGETPEESLKRCYPALLEARAQRYRAMAHVSVPYDIHKKDGADAAPLLDLCR